MSLNQLIKGQKMKIAQNPFTLSGDLSPKVPDGIGGYKREGIPLSQSYNNPVRIAKGFIDPGNSLGSKEPKDDMESWIIEADVNTNLDVGLEFNYQGMRFRILAPLFPYVKFGGLYGWGANLQKINQEDDIL